jgi:hypothetical protein
VPDRRRIVEPVDGGAGRQEVGAFDALDRGPERRRRAVRVLGGEVELGPVAGGDDQRFANGIAAQGFRQHTVRGIRCERKGFALGERRRPVIHADDKEMHGRTPHGVRRC